VTNDEHVTGFAVKGAYRDSVALMRLATALEARPGVTRAAALMATPANRQILEQTGLGSGLAVVSELLQHAGPADLVVVLMGRADVLDDACDAARALLADDGTVPDDNGTSTAPAGPRSLAGAVARLPTANLAMISTPGPYAAAECQKALKQGLHVFCFSDNVSLQDEIRLKRLANQRGLLLMGPDCGTALIAGVPLGFTNAVRRGHIGLVGASGTGLQEVMSLVDRAGEGISHVIGAGSRDLHAGVGGITTRAGLSLLAADRGTNVIVVVSKPPDPGLAADLIETAQSLGKPVVVCFLGAQVDVPSGLHVARTLEEAACLAVALRSGSMRSEIAAAPVPTSLSHAPACLAEHGIEPGPPRGRILGLFSGGTLCSEANVVLGEEASAAWYAAELIDLGDDRYTVGRPHPMIDPRDRVARIRAAAEDPSVGVLILDVVLGFGAHPDPASALAPAVAEAIAVRKGSDSPLEVVASVCGVDTDPQDRVRQCRMLAAAGIRIAPSNAAAARLAARLVYGGCGDA
jgi:succinyl-CoA synthetase alpha subunit